MNFKFIKQPTGNSCGPTCLYMILDYILNKRNVFNPVDGQHALSLDVELKYSVQDICDICGTDWIVGTTPERMIKGMKALNINHTEYIYSPRPYDLLKNVIDSQNIPILRTITKDVPHWIIIESYNKNLFNVLDPWLGKIQYTEKDLDDIWKVRNYQFFEILVNENN